MASAATAPVVAAAHRRVALMPPFRFSHVESNLFRSAYPMPRNHAFLRTLRLRTIVSLTDEVDATLQKVPAPPPPPPPHAHTQTQN